MLNNELFANRNSNTITLKFKLVPINPSDKLNENRAYNVDINNKLMLETKKQLSTAHKNAVDEFLNIELINQDIIKSLYDAINNKQKKQIKEIGDIILENVVTTIKNKNIYKTPSEIISTLGIKLKATNFEDYNKTQKSVFYGTGENSISFRVLENLKIFLDNVIIINKIKNNIVFDFDTDMNYNNYLKQCDIEYYNNNIVNKINNDINIYNQNQKQKKNKLTNLVKLKNQIFNRIDDTKKIDKKELLTEIKTFFTDNDLCFDSVAESFENNFEKNVIKVKDINILSHLLYNDGYYIKNNYTIPENEYITINDIGLLYDSNLKLIINGIINKAKESVNVLTKIDNIDIKNIKTNFENIKTYNKLLKLINYEELYKSINDFYTDVKNCLTNIKKYQYSTNFSSADKDNNTFGSGWTYIKKSKLSILRKDGKYYLLVLNCESEILETNSDSNNCYEKMTYFVNNAKSIARCTTSLKDIVKHFEKYSNDIVTDYGLTISKEIYDLCNNYYNIDTKTYKCKKDITKINDNTTFKKTSIKYKEINEVEYYESLYKYIDFVKVFLTKHEKYKKYNYSFKDTTEYTDLSEFFFEIESATYNIHFNEKISVDVINNLNSKGDIFLFEIYTKDFSDKSYGIKNKHTLIFNELFGDLDNLIHKLNGGVSIKYREQLIYLNDEKKKEGYHKGETNHKIIKDKRYTEEQYTLHIPITLNYKKQSRDNINNVVNNFIKNNKIENIIGIDRGENNLIYVVVYNSTTKEIIEQKSLNIINDKCYFSLIKKNIEERKEAQKNWDVFKGSKNIKEGYLSHAIYYIAELVKKYNAIIVLENLNFSDKRGKKTIEAQTYQKFEDMLINYFYKYVDKTKKSNEIGSARNIIQVTDKNITDKKQNGIVFYVDPSYTSKICPVSGFINLFKFRHDNLTEAKTFYNNFTDIVFNGCDFVFSFNYSNFKTHIKPYKNDWIVYSSDVERYNYDVRSKKTKVCLVTTELKNLFIEYGIDILNDLQKQIVLQTNLYFFKKLSSILNVLFNLRQKNKDNDFILSPVYPFFNSNKNTNKNLPNDSDANGAYNIAQKGSIILNKINNGFVDLSVSLEDYLKIKQS